MFHKSKGLWWIAVNYDLSGFQSIEIITEPYCLLCLCLQLYLMDIQSASSVVLQALTQATSQDTAVLKPAEEQLRQWETQPGFYSVLLVRICYIQPQYEQFSGAIEQSKSENVGNNILCGFYSFISVIHVSWASWHVKNILIQVILYQAKQLFILI